MAAMTQGTQDVLNLRAGEVVEVRSRAEILATLDAQGRKDALPFMPEMLKYCGQRLRVYKRADKTCDTIRKTGARRMVHAVHLEETRCDGCAHGGCQAGCLMFWKEAWLKRVGDDVPRVASDATVCSEEALYQACRRDPADAGGEAFSCQTTELFDATSYLAWWDPRQYIRDIRSGNVGVADWAFGIFVASFNMIVRAVRRGVFAAGHALTSRLRPRVVADDPVPATGASAANGAQAAQQSIVVRVRTALDNTIVQYPDVRGQLLKTPTARLDLEPGEYVRVRSRQDIVATLDVRNRNRGLLFDVEMVPYCGGTYRVLRRVEKILDERTGRMLKLPSSCVVLDGVVCKGCLSSHRLFCPRSTYPYWHEIWLERSRSSEIPS